MKQSSGARLNVSRALMLGASSIAIGLVATPAMAQDAGPGQDEAADPDDVIIVEGIRASLNTAQEIKRNSDTVVDVVTAQDIGALPDRSVSEVLQRVPGVSVLRFAGPNDPDHFAVEGSGVVIRGLPFVRSELNGRDVFGANSGGALGFEDVSPELLGSVVVYKNSSADLIEGGAAGTIDLRTRLPFDQRGEVFAFTAELNYTDLADELTPTVSALYSNEFDIAGGRLGFLGNIAYSQLRSRADGTGLTDFVPRGTGPADEFIPSGGSIRSQEFNRERFSVAGAAQWESDDGRWIATAQFLRSDSSLVWGESVIETVADSASPRQSLDDSDFVFDEDGVFVQGTISDNAQWRGRNATAANFPSNGGQQLALRRERGEQDRTEDYGFNLRFAPTDRLRFNFDAQYVTSEAEVEDLTVHTSFFAPLFVDNTSGDTPTLSLVTPAGAAADYFQDPSNYFLRSALDFVADNEADSYAFRGDVEYDFSDDGFLRSVRAGGRYNRQESTIRESDFNWGNISEVWTDRDIQGQSGGDFNQINSVALLAGNPNPAINRVISPLFSSFTFQNYQRGLPTGLGGPIPIYSGPQVGNFQGFQDTFNSIIDVLYGEGNFSPSGWRPLTSRAGVIEGTPFLPSEIGQISRENYAAYVRLDFGADFGSGVDLSGNVGVRYVHTDRSVDSSLAVDPFDTVFPPDAVALCSNPDVTNPPGFCNLDLASLEAALGDGFFVERTLESSYDFFLPSFNAKVEFPGGHVIRGAASRTLTRPGVNQLNERLVLQSEFGEAVAVPNSNPARNVNPFERFVGNATGNANLIPQLSWNFDLSYEWYFDNAGSITIAGFYKSIDNFIAFAPTAVDLPEDQVPAAFLANPVTNPLLRNAEVNSDETASVQGFEVAYQQFYDFLPGPLAGLGVQATYTYIDAEGVANQLDPSIPSDDPPTARFAIDEGVFPRISEHNVNLIGLYEYGPVQARVAWNWRSEFQLTPRDVIFPFASIYQPATGQVDASLFVELNDALTIGVQGVNLLDDVTETTQTISEDGLRAPRNFFRNDRRISFVVRGNF